MRHYPTKPAALAALDIAIYDAFCKYLDIPILDFCGRKKKDLATSITIGIKNVDETVKEASEYVLVGFKILKVKLGFNLEEDIERLCKLKEIHSNIVIRVDANQGYDQPQTIRFFQKTEDLNIELVEQPFPVNQFPLSFLPYKYATKLAADKSLQTVKDAFKLVSSSTCTPIFNIKLMKCGGIYQAMKIAKLATYSNTKLMWGCNDESIISITAALHAAYANEYTRYIDLDGSFDLVYDMVNGGFKVEDGQMFITDGVGFGFQKMRNEKL